MYEWNERKQIGCSPYYCSRQFNRDIRQEVFSPYHYLIRGRDKMNKVHLQSAEIKVEFIPALL
ncbi:hypothetical protein FPZ44_18700 [Paenibacillus agilis]|uniref:Uncharacterized protein n=1 Tax=Paenibacillus agilis TaxID=3020863 RepID=A0A559IQ65_9BACL|nr:hypothetical protein FPZ44_18700 [Paenibacillus agilis]